MKSADLKRSEADERNDFWQRLTTAEKLAALDAKLGKGQGAKKQRAQLAKEK